MIGGRATWVLAAASLRRQPSAAEAIATVGAAGAAFGGATAYALAAAGIAAAALAPLGTARTRAVTDLRLFAAPLYGRELARALVLGPCARLAALTGATGAAAWAAAGALGHAVGPAPWAWIALVIAAELVATLVATSGCLRRGADRRLYVALALAGGACVALIGASLAAAALAAAAIAAAVIGFAALRALGETLARYDPIE
jgi:hypothetical protein